MVKWAQNAKDNLFKNALERNFIDPITNKAPTSEIELTSLLAYYQKLKRINWNAVPVYYTEKKEILKANVLFPNDGIVLSEYLLMCPFKEDIKYWGDMKADIMYLINNCENITLLENKIGSKQTHGAMPESSKLASQLKYLMKFTRKESYLVVLTLNDMFERGWYINDLRNISKCHNNPSNIICCSILWEDVLCAFVA